jgi:hypothetical protein
VIIGGAEYTVIVNMHVNVPAYSDGKAKTLDTRNWYAVKKMSTDDNIGNGYYGQYKTTEPEFNTDYFNNAEVGNSNGKEITMLRNMTKTFTQSYFDREQAISHEMGHNLGEGDPGDAYYSKGGAMNYKTFIEGVGTNPPTMEDVKNIIRYGLDALANKSTTPANAPANGPKVITQYSQPSSGNSPAPKSKDVQ